MILKFNVPGEILKQITLDPDEKIYYSVPFDIAQDGSWQTNSYLIVSTGHLWIISEGSLKEKINISDCRDCKAEAKIGSTEEQDMATPCNGI